MSPQIKRPAYEDFSHQVLIDEREGRVEISATVSEEAAKAFEDSEEVFGEGSAVTLTDIARARFVSQGDARIVGRVEAAVGPEP